MSRLHIVIFYRKDGPTLISRIVNIYANSTSEASHKVREQVILEYPDAYGFEASVVDTGYNLGARPEDAGVIADISFAQCGSWEGVR